MKKSLKKRALGVILILLFGISAAVLYQINQSSKNESNRIAGNSTGINNNDKNQNLTSTWQRPPGPLRIGLQVGHWKSGELPDELKNLREYGGGSEGGGKAEWEVNLAIARDTAKLLEEKGFVVDILPATVPPNYWADIFIAIHADGSTNPSVSGFKVAAPWRDPTGKSEQFASELQTVYGALTKLRIDPNVTRNMRGYYAFNYHRYEHAISPNTPAVIIETGFLTDPSDRNILISHPEKAADGIAQAVLSYFNRA